MMSWMTLIVILVAAALAWVEIPSLRKHQQKKELVVFSVCLGLFVVLGVMKSMNMPIPNPMDALYVIFKPLSLIVFGKDT